MKTYLLKQFSDKTNLVNWANEMYRQGTVALLSRDRRKPSNDIKPDLFARSLISAVAESQLVQNNLKYLQELHTINYPRDPQLAEQAQDAEHTVKQLDLYKQPVMRHFKAAVMLLQPSDQRRLFSDALQYAEMQTPQDAVSREADVYQHLVIYLENWFTELTERMTLWYKKKTRQRLFFIGLALALLLNVDSVQLFTLLNHNPETRRELINFYEKGQEHLTGLTAHIDSINNAQITAAKAAKNKKQVDEEPVYSVDAITELNSQQQLTLDSLIRQTTLPIGITHSIFYGSENGQDSQWLLKLTGLLISAFAASFGAPFWFDVMRKAYAIK